MTREQKCIAKMYRLLREIEAGARKRDLSLLIPKGAGPQDMYAGLPLLSRYLDSITSEYKDVINTAICSAVNQEEGENE